MLKSKSMLPSCKLNNIEQYSFTYGYGTVSAASDIMVTTPSGGWTTLLPGTRLDKIFALQCVMPCNEWKSNVMKVAVGHQHGLLRFIC